VYQIRVKMAAGALSFGTKPFVTARGLISVVRIARHLRFLCNLAPIGGLPVKEKIHITR